MIKKILMLALSLGLLSACNEPETVVTVDIDQQQLCEVSHWQKDASALVCKAGQKILYLPSSVENEQLPVLFAAVNCDHRFSIALTKAGVACIYTPLSMSKAEARDAIGKDEIIK
ncbi:hypothetical protein [Oceanisphaera avium]|uniref:Lipoprotein n=1 Tax=Oceanisphaera avium TaxID=1903694 RepID=A0A1Y0CVT7_9GAMM|nr:hypothetical protein [Oceanisphaera avium]ART79412.1 hypothetical protein CBP12_03975 [Oceanisphaera avium]